MSSAKLRPCIANIQVSHLVHLKIMFNQSYQCASCQGKLDANNEVDYTNAQIFNGTVDICSLRALCSVCHLHKASEHIRPTSLEHRKRRRDATFDVDSIGHVSDCDEEASFALLDATLSKPEQIELGQLSCFAFRCNRWQRMHSI